MCLFLNYVLGRQYITFLSAGKSVQLSTSNGGYDYPSNVNTTWIFQTEEDRKIRINFQIYAPSYRSRCTLRAGDGNSSAHFTDMFFEWSRRDFPPSRLLSDGNAMWLKFEPDRKESSCRVSLSASSVPSTGTCAIK